MNQTVGHSNTLISPKGCHVDFDPSFECLKLTLIDWFMLSMSDVIVSQTIPGDRNQSRGVSSSFSRYAGMYGLQNDVYRDSRNCGTIVTSNEYSRMDISNWFC